jgi:Arc/MetJ-type ribon-helix-helix transcriptional regulator
MNHMLTREMQALIAAEVARGTYASADEFLRAMTETFADATVREAIRSTWLRAAVKLADEEGGELTADELFGPAIERLRQRDRQKS